MAEFLIALAIGVLACAVWFLMETAMQGLRAKMRAKKEQRTPAKGRCSCPKEGE
jgi:hypothetical protein